MTERLANPPVVLIGFQQMGNLGLGYLSAVLEQAGFRVLVLDIETPPERLVAAVKEARPLMVGFSLIFQFYIRRYRALMAAMRREGVDAHFTMGGHYASLAYAPAMEAVPELDSIVRYEGETTVVELARALAAGDDWRGIQGIVHRVDGTAVANPDRPLAPDLDALPFPRRDFEPVTMLGRKALPIIASRGCARTCSFCSIHTFYRTAPGKVVRLRRPAEVVREMRMLHEERGASIFLFQDDDFPLYGPKWRAWAGQLVDEIHAAGLANRILWKVNCRADAVDVDLLIRMRGAGLYMVYMGLESGTEQGLKVLNKEITVAQNRRAVRLLKSIGLRFEYGFMLLDPLSTFATVRENIGFLRAIVGDGCAPATFCKMLPYDGTPIKETLAAQGRLKGDVTTPDYDFLDPRLDRFYVELARIIQTTGWVHGPRALNMSLEWAHSEAAVMRGLLPDLPGMATYEATLRRHTRAANAALFDLVLRLADRHETGEGAPVDLDEIQAFRDDLLERVVADRDRFITRRQDAILESLEAA